MSIKRSQIDQNFKFLGFYLLICQIYIYMNTLLKYSNFSLFKTNFVVQSDKKRYFLLGKNFTIKHK